MYLPCLLWASGACGALRWQDAAPQPRAHVEEKDAAPSVPCPTGPAQLGSGQHGLLRAEHGVEGGTGKTGV